MRWLAGQLSGVYAKRLLAYATELEAQAGERADEGKAEGGCGGAFSALRWDI